MLCNTAIFYDIENLLGLFGGKTNTVLHLDEIHRRVLETEGVHGVSIQRAYADWALPQHRNLRASVLQVGIEPVHIFNTNQHDKVKNAADVSLIIDAVDLMHRQPEIENYVIASGDGIFAFLAKKLHERGKRVIGCGFEKIVNIIFRNACDYFIGLEKSDASLIATSSGRKKKSAVIESFPPPIIIETLPAKAAPSAQSVPSTPSTRAAGNFPKTKYTEALIAANIEVLRDTGDSSACFHTVRSMVDAIFTDDTKDMPGLEISVFTNYISYYLPNFKVTRHGFKRISDFIRFILSGSPFCMYSVEDNVLLMGARAGAKGKIVEDIGGLIITTAGGAKYNSVFNMPAGEPFTYTIVPDAKPAPVVPQIAGSFRKWIKEQFEELSQKNLLPMKEIRRLSTDEGAMATFGIRSPIFKKIETRSNLVGQRTDGGKVKYWKEDFRFHATPYIVYKEWVAKHHQDRFVTWLNNFKK